jgi:hypothetical protein
MGFTEAVGRTLLINEEFTRRGIAPAWRRIPEFVRPDGFARVSVKTEALGIRKLGDATKRNLLRRWIDLQWLRELLGPTHKATKVRWRDVFSADLVLALRAFAQVNAVLSTSGSTAEAETPYKVVAALNVPKLVRLGLTGLVDRDAGELRKNAQKRVRDKIKPKLEALMSRSTYALTQAEVDRRLLIAEAVELGVGMPSDSATVFCWMTGEVIARQSIFVARGKIAEQCGLSGRAWMAKKSRSNPI